MLTSYLRAQWLSIIVATTFAVCLGLISAVVAALVGPAFQTLMIQDTATMIQIKDLVGVHLAPLVIDFLGYSEISAKAFIEKIPLALIALASLKLMLSVSQWFLWERVGEVVSKNLRLDLVKRFMFLDPNARRIQGQEMSEANLSSALSTDIKMMREFIVHFYGGLPREGLQVAFLFGTLVLLSPQQALIFILGVAPVVGLIAKLGKKLRRRAGAALKDFSQLTEWLQQRLLGVETIKHYGTETIESQKMTALNLAMYQRFYKAVRVKASSSPLIELIASIALVLVLFVALKQISTGQTTGAIQLSFFSTLALLTQAAGKLGRYLNTNREGAAAIARLEELKRFLDDHHTSSTEITVKDTAAKESLLVIKNVSVTYPGTSKNAVENLSISFRGGKLYCICGPSGAGKSTLFNVILGLVKVEKGEVYTHLTSNPEGGVIGYMPQKIRLVPASIAHNIAYPGEEIDREKVYASLKEVGLNQLADSMSDNIDSIVGQDGQGLSGGQAQRIQLARIHYHGHPIVLVDEGTSALDPETEVMIYKFLRELVDTGSIVIMIAHRLSATNIADEIVLMKDGRLVTSGAAKTVRQSAEFSSYLN